jgi:hypothetical protein
LIRIVELVSCEDDDKGDDDEDVELISGLESSALDELGLELLDSLRVSSGVGGRRKPGEVG